MAASSLRGRLWTGWELTAGRAADRFACRVLGWHGRGCRSRADHLALWSRQ